MMLMGCLAIGQVIGQKSAAKDRSNRLTILRNGVWKMGTLNINRAIGSVPSPDNIQ